jgi:hypothetical protein
MQVGVFYFPTDYGIDIAKLAQALETHGFASLGNYALLAAAG